jgi:hypothetical protein
MDHKAITTKQELLDRMFALLDEADAVEWPSQTPYTFIQHMAAWLDQAQTRGVDTNCPTWDLFAQMLEAGRGHEH